MKTYRLILLGLTMSLPILSLAKDGHYARCEALTLANPPEDIRPLAPVAMQAMPNAKAAATPSRTMTVKAKKTADCAPPSRQYREIPASRAKSCSSCDRPSSIDVQY